MPLNSLNHQPPDFPAGVLVDCSAIITLSNSTNLRVCWHLYTLCQLVIKILCATKIGEKYWGKPLCEIGNFFMVNIAVNFHMKSLQPKNLATCSSLKIIFLARFLDWLMTKHHSENSLQIWSCSPYCETQPPASFWLSSSIFSCLFVVCLSVPHSDISSYLAQIKKLKK